MFLLLEALRERMCFSVLDCPFCCTVRGETFGVVRGGKLGASKFFMEALDVS